VDKSRGALEEITKEGVFTGRYCVNPVTGWDMPIFVANFVLMGYGTGAVMAVPAHDQRDFEFARKYGQQIKVVIQPPGEELQVGSLTQAYEEDGVLVNSASFSGMESGPARAAIAAYLAEQNLGAAAEQFRLRDWGISRQRYWGAPIPIIYCEACGAVPVPEQDLPVVLPLNVEIKQVGASPLAGLESFWKVPCPVCGGPARKAPDQPRVLMTTRGEVAWKQRVANCPRCRRAFFRSESSVGR